MEPSAELSNILRDAETIAVDEKNSIDKRVPSVKIMELDPRDGSFSLFEKMLEPHEPSEIQLAAVNALLRSQQDKATNILLNKWNLLKPNVHDVAENGFLARKDRLQLLLKAIENDKIKPTWLSRNARNRLLKNSDATVREKAKDLFKDIAGGGREKIILDYNVATTNAGDAVKGKTVFKTSCSVCHKLENVGVNFGPDLHALSNQTKINLLTMILDPNSTIAAGYEGYIIETVDGATTAGIVESENNLNLILKGPGAVVQNILKSNIKSMSPMSSSLMPEGLEASINKEDMADLLEYLKTLK